MSKEASLAALDVWRVEARESMLKNLRATMPDIPDEKFDWLVSELDRLGQELAAATIVEPVESEPLPKILEFKYYMHDNCSRNEFAEHLEDETGYEINEELLEKIDRPFYEIGFDCTLDTQTGEVKILNIRE